MDEQDFKYHRDALQRGEKYSFLFGFLTGIGWAYLIYEWSKVFVEIWK